MVSIPACHAGDRGSIPRHGALLVLILTYLHFTLCFWPEHHLLSFSSINVAEDYRHSKDVKERVQDENRPYSPADSVASDDFFRRLVDFVDDLSHSSMEMSEKSELEYDLKKNCCFRAVLIENLIFDKSMLTG